MVLRIHTSQVAKNCKNVLEPRHPCKYHFSRGELSTFAALHPAGQFPPQQKDNLTHREYYAQEQNATKTFVEP